MKHTIKHLLHINASLSDVFSAITDAGKLSQWYTSDVEDNVKTDGSFTFKWGTMFITTKVEVSAEKNKISWDCIDTNLPAMGHMMSFELDENEGKTRLRYTHTGFDDDGDFYSNQNFSTAKYMESLRQFCQTGNGEGYGTTGYRS